VSSTASSASKQKRDERWAVMFLTVVLAPIIAVVVVAGFGFCVWIYQMVAGPPAM